MAVERERVAERALHLSFKCPCNGDPAHCSYWRALDAIRWQEQRVGYFAKAVERAQESFDEARAALRKAKANHLREQQRLAAVRSERTSG